MANLDERWWAVTVAAHRPDLLSADMHAIAEAVLTDPDLTGAAAAFTDDELTVTAHIQADTFEQAQSKVTRGVVDHAGPWFDIVRVEVMTEAEFLRDPERPRAHPGH